MTGWITLITRLSLFFTYLKIKKGQFGYMTRMMRFLILKQTCRLDALPGLRSGAVYRFSAEPVYCKCILLEYHMPLLRIFLKGKSVCMWKNGFAKCRLFRRQTRPLSRQHGLLHLKISTCFSESLVMLLLSVLDVKTYRDDARLNEWISNRVQELGDRYYL